MPVDTVRIEVSKRQKRWERIDDLLNNDVKNTEVRTRYLPKPNPSDDSDDNNNRYDQYVSRSVLYNFVKRTLEGLRGTVMEKPAEINIPTSMEYILGDVDGNGLSLEQQTRQVLGGVLSKGRYGLLASYPDNTAAMDDDGFISKEMVEKLGIRAYCSTYHPLDIINWQMDRIGATVLTTLIVLREEYNSSEDEFAVDIQDQYRVLRLGYPDETIQTLAGQAVPENTMVYYQYVHRDSRIAEATIPLKGNGEFFDEIPFRFVGSEDNSPSMDDIPLEDLTEVNFGHYRNSADFEEACFLLGQPQVTAVGMTEHWIKEVWGGKMYFGSRAIITGPEGANFGLLQVSPNTMAMEGMKYKEEVMIRLGAQLVTADSSKRTATEALMDNRSDNSVLSSIADNVSQAYEDILEFMAEFNGDDPSEITYILNQNYGARDATPEQINAWLGALAQNAMSLTTFLKNMKAGNQLPEDTTVEDEEKAIKERLTNDLNITDGLDDDDTPKGGEGNSGTGEDGEETGS